MDLFKERIALAKTALTQIPEAREYLSSEEAKTDLENWLTARDGYKFFGKTVLSEEEKDSLRQNLSVLQESLASTPP